MNTRITDPTAPRQTHPAGSNPGAPIFDQQLVTAHIDLSAAPEDVLVNTLACGFLYMALTPMG
jgi:hypothetical protein